MRYSVVLLKKPAIGHIDIENVADVKTTGTSLCMFDEDENVLFVIDMKHILYLIKVE